MRERKQKMISAIVFLAIIFLLPLIFIFTKKENFSETENRPLADRPSFSLSAIADKSYMNDMGTFISDNFPARIGFVRTKMLLDRLSGREEINGIYLGDDMLLERLQTPDYKEVSRSVQAINNFAEHYPNTSVYMMLVPTSAGIYTDKLPGSAPQLNQGEFIEDTCSGLSGNIQTINVFDTLMSEKDNYIYYRTDHHWTSYGAYCAYRQASSQLGFSPVDLDKFDIEHASTDFRGTFYNKCFYNGVEKDVIDIYTHDNGNKVTEVVLNDGRKTETTDSIYFRDFLKGNDKYCVFLGSNRACTTIRTDALNKKKILVIKDSYANSFVPFLTNHYSEITLIDLRYVKNSIKDFVNPSDYNHTLFLYNASTFASDKNVKAAGFFE